LVTQLSATGLPPSARPMDGRATAVPVNVSGMAAAARHMARRTNVFSIGLLVEINDAMIFIQVSRERM
jgi:hypothetical protein